ncbi:glycosyltransferase [Patescibacteria group bacterium]|nr:glycosyltransferase [Patescibacteria group bacterium]
MEKVRLPISVLIRTLNEETNISDCIKACQANNPGEIIVADGNSSDQTREIAQALGVIVVIAEQGLATQRDAGIKVASFPYIIIVDADDRLKDDCLSILLKEMEVGGYDAINAQYRNFYDWPKNNSVRKKTSYWEKAMEVNLNLICTKTGETNMIGRPALFRTTALKQIPLDPIFKKASEDSDLSYRFHLAGFRQAIGSGITYRKHLSSFRACVKKFLMVGGGEALFVSRHPERLWGNIKHELYTYPIKRSYLAIRAGHIKYVPFFILVGWLRFFGFISTMIKIVFKKILFNR